MSVVLHVGDGGEELDVLCCDLCGRRQTVDPGLPYVNQASSFSTDHRCGEPEGASAGGW